MADIWVWSEKPALLAELIAGALSLDGGATVTALVLGPRAAAEEALSRGAGRVLWLGEAEEGALVEDAVPTLAGLVQERQPALLLVGATLRGKAVAGRVAARLGVTVLTDVMRFEGQGEALQAQHMIFGGGAVRMEKPLRSPVIATVASGVFEAQPAQPGASGEVEEVPWVEPPWCAKLVERRERPPATVNLSAARRVICCGRGLARQEDLAMVEELARALGAEVACTRPLAEGLDWLPRERYIGISGAHVRPDLYLGVGVSGQVQHLIGMGDSRVVVAINKDSGAPIFGSADYGIPADLYAVVPALIQALKSRR